MANFKVHDQESAPEGARTALQAAERALDFVPNLFGILAESPAALQAYLALAEQFEKCSLSPSEKQVVLLTVSFENGCQYCMAAHSALAAMQKVPQDVVQALRDGTPIADPRLEALRVFTGQLTAHRADLDQKKVDAFLGAGYTKAQLLEVLVGVTQKTLSNYTNHLAHTPLDPAFEASQWEKPAKH